MRTWEDFQELIHTHQPFQANTVGMYLNDFFGRDIAISYRLEAEGPYPPLMRASITLTIAKDKKPAAPAKVTTKKGDEPLISPVNVDDDDDYDWVNRDGFAPFPAFTSTGITQAQTNALLNAMENLGASVEYDNLTAFTWPSAPASAAPTASAAPAATFFPVAPATPANTTTTVSSGPKCGDCGKTITEYPSKNSDRMVSVKWQVEKTTEEYGHPVCKNCNGKRRAA